jgi:hypothetical protein
MDEIDLLAAVQTLLEVKRTCRDRRRRINPTRLTQPDAHRTATRSLVGARAVLIRTLWMLI